MRACTHKFYTSRDNWKPFFEVNFSKLRILLRESSFNMTRGEMKILRGARKIFRHPKGGL